MNRTRIKICGITRQADADIAVAAGADALGFVFYDPSPRNVSVEQAADIIRGLPAFVTSTALFVNAEPTFVQQVIDETGIDLLQFHGNEDVAYCEQFSRPYMKAIRMKPDVDVAAECQRYTGAAAVLLDAYRPGVPGGTGESFDWERIPAELRGSIVLAGGLNPDNIRRAVETVRPFAVDVSGGVEASKGIKDKEKVEKFTQEVNRAYQD
ncbi:phosphoribosylanthranilate isomerase [Pontibacterium granulatum]|uniref:phosphoribosylanthranilate isomerase n=1 Tax=Pontibacterium granulatum TaxID=2036029 RepID=UPI00249AB519|nr:phosphoribosylanthranilate isomerase [Pontibacterium granulatum]MDI3325004.1 phosphoribosylanthranilate isomerase [Pontibacterium granulatum]